MSGRLQRRVALLPVARAELIGLQRIEHAQNFIWTAADVEVGHVHEADDALRIDDVGRPLRNTGFGIEDPERVRQLALDVREHREWQITQLLLLLAPGKVHELAVCADAEKLCVARLEFVVELAECGNLGRADEGEVLRQKENDLARGASAVVRERPEAFVDIVRDDAGQGVGGKFLSNVPHDVSVSMGWCRAAPGNSWIACWRIRPYCSNRLI